MLANLFCHNKKKIFSFPLLKMKKSNNVYTFCVALYFAVEDKLIIDMHIGCANFWCTEQS